MKITVDLPESTLAVTMTYVWRDPADRMTISCAVFEENEVKDGGKAKFPKHYTEETE